jgi:hypothetical protein
LIDHTIASLPALVAALPAESRTVFDRIFHVDQTIGELRLPETMLSFVEGSFGQAADVEKQQIVRVTNRVTLESSLFNWLRARRPLWPSHIADISKELAETHYDPLCDPYTNTPEDVFGRIKGKYCVTASNVAKFEGFHGLVVYQEHNPLDFNREMLHDYVDTGRRWAEEAHRSDALAKYYLFIWNCLWKAGASLVHGHAQVMLGRTSHYGHVEYLRRSALQYDSLTGQNYFHDLFLAHAALGCAFEKAGVRVLTNLTPIKEREILLIAPEVNEAFKDVLYDVLAFYRDLMGVTSFNLAIYSPPLDEVEENWQGFPVLARLVDRGDPQSRTSDFASMELYASSVVASDPLQLGETLRQHLGLR